MFSAINLTATSFIKENDIRDIVNNLPNDLKGFSGENSWGWSAATDICKTTKKTLTISGAWFSAEIAKRMARVLKSKLSEKGYIIKIGQFSG